MQTPAYCITLHSSRERITKSWAAEVVPLIRCLNPSPR